MFYSLGATFDLLRSLVDWGGIGIPILKWASERLLGPLIAGLILTLFGSWWIGRANERFKGRRDHANKSVDALRNQIEQIVSSASEYWLTYYKGNTATKKEAELLYKLDDISNLVEACAAELWTDDANGGPALVADLMASIVTPTFGVKGRLSDPSRPAAISKSAIRLSQALTSNRHAYFK